MATDEDTKTTQEHFKRIGPIKEQMDRGTAWLQGRPEVKGAINLVESSKENTLLKPVAEQAERAMKAVDGDSVLLKVDNKVDSVLKAYEETRTKSAKDFDEAREHYFKLVEDTLEGIRRKAINVPANLLAHADKFIARARSAMPNDSNELVEQVHEAWKRVMEHPQVAQAVESVGPHAKSAFDQIRSIIKSSPGYSFIEPLVAKARPFVDILKKEADKADPPEGPLNADEQVTVPSERFTEIFDSTEEAESPRNST